MSKIRNIEELRTAVLEAFEMVRDNPESVDQGKEMANLAGKAISTVKMQLNYSELRKEQPSIPFMVS